MPKRVLLITKMKRWFNCLQSLALVRVADNNTGAAILSCEKWTLPLT